MTLMVCQVRQHDSTDIPQEWITQVHICQLDTKLLKTSPTTECGVIVNRILSIH